jgi:hypothetical protein
VHDSEFWTFLLAGVFLCGIGVLVLVKDFLPQVPMLVLFSLGIFFVGALFFVEAWISAQSKAKVQHGQVVHNSPPFDDLALYVKDWEMTKDRIKHFDDIVVRIRLSGIPIATGIIAVGIALLQKPDVTQFKINFLGYQVPAASLIFLAAVLFLIPIALLDWLHYNLLIRSVNHGIELEEKDELRERLSITRVLTSPNLTRAHSIAAATIYLSIAIIAVTILLNIR